MPRLPRLLLLLAAAVAVIVLGAFDPEEFSFFPKCPFLMLTGLKCPGCGTQRAIHQLMHLHIGEAFGYNALMVMSIPLLVFLAVSEVLRRRFPKLQLAATGPALSWGILAVVLLWWVLRNIFGW